MHYLTFLELNADNITVHQASIIFTEAESNEADKTPASASVGRGQLFPAAKLPCYTISFEPIGSYEIRKTGITYLDEAPGIKKVLSLDLSSLGHNQKPDTLTMLVTEESVRSYTGEKEPELMLNILVEPSITDYNLEKLSRKYGLIVMLTVLWACYWPTKLMGGMYKRVVPIQSVLICEGHSSQCFLLKDWKENPNMMIYDTMPVLHYRRMKVLNQVIASVSMKDDEFTFIFVKSDVDAHNPENRYLTTTVLTLNDSMSLITMIKELEFAGQWKNKGLTSRSSDATIKFLRYLG